VPKVNPKGVADGNQVNIPEPVGSDGFFLFVSDNWILLAILRGSRNSSNI
jgi:hypothetical protein